MKRVHVLSMNLFSVFAALMAFGCAAQKTIVQPNAVVPPVNADVRNFKAEREAMKLEVQQFIKDAESVPLGSSSSVALEDLRALLARGAVKELRRAKYKGLYKEIGTAAQQELWHAVLVNAIVYLEIASSGVPACVRDMGLSNGWALLTTHDRLVKVLAIHAILMRYPVYGHCEKQ